MNYLCRCRFLGCAYRGFQVQVQDNTICHVLQDALEHILQERPDIKGCSRTDSGVHANEYFFNFHLNRTLDTFRLPRALNTFLPADIAVNGVWTVPEEFHARYAGHEKEYLYQIQNTGVRDPFLSGRALLYPRRLDEEKMNRAAQDYLGRHDFTSFCDKRSDVVDKVRTISLSTVTRKGDLVFYRVRGTGFLYHMVRIMVGTLLQIDQGLYDGAAIPEMLAARRRSAAGWTAPPEGLYLNRVFYDAGLTGTEQGGR